MFRSAKSAIDCPRWPIMELAETELRQFGGIRVNTRYAFSLNGTDWRGEFASRKEARAAAISIARDLEQPPATVYVGKLSATDGQITGHALPVIKAINQRTELSGKPVYLTGMKIDQVAELDKELAATLDRWLKKYKLEPAASVSGISEYPLPSPVSVKSGPSDEVKDLGVSRWVGDF
jgi:hypothetical protein